jgi:omega-6 fatty acid desaturase (delta-12 desaturase)
MATVAPYQVPDSLKAWVQVANSFLPYLLIWGLMVWSVQIHYAITLLLALPAVGFLMRIFIIQHDCGHGSFFKNNRLNAIVGSIAGVLTLTPYHLWRKSHAIHHAGSSNLNKRGTGDIITWTVQEYMTRSKWQRLKYRLYRSRIVMFALGPPFMFAFLQRLPPGRHLTPNERHSLIWTNVAIVAIAAAGIWLLGWKTFLMVQIPITFLASNAGTWMFYVQHQFEDTYWARRDKWDYFTAAMKGSSYYKLPKVLQWFSGNIGFHHIHHLSALIPNYHLPRAFKENVEFHKVTTLTLRSSLKTATLTLWDEKKQKMVDFAYAHSLMRAQPAGA